VSKKPTDQHDSFDDLLARHLRARLNESGGDCPDEDLLAAYRQHLLAGDEFGQIEQHVSDCGPCQSRLAALAAADLEEERTSLAPDVDGAAEQAVANALPQHRGWALLDNLRSAFRFMMGPFPISITLHVLALLFLVITYHQQRGRELIMVNLEAGGGGGGGGEEMQDLYMPEVPMPDTAPTQMDQPVSADTSQAVGLAQDYVRTAGGGGIGIGRGGGIGSGYGHGVGSGFGGFIGELRRKGLDVVLVVDGTGSMKLIIEDVKTRMQQLVRAVHRLVPIARVGVVVFGGKGESMQIQPLTLSADKLAQFLGGIKAMGGGEWEEDTMGACQKAINKMDWKQYAKKVVVLVGDSPPHKEDLQPLMALIRGFKINNGTFNTIDVAAEEHERFEREFWLKVHRQEPPSISPLPEFYQQTRQAYKVLAGQGGGAMRSLSKDAHINQQVLILAFGEQWQQQVAAFGRGITSAGDK
jgi:hypothetical protein